MTLLNMSFYGAVIILAILIIRAFALHKLPKKTFLILWAVALVRLLVPFEIASGFSLYSLLPEAFIIGEQNDVYAPNKENPKKDFEITILLSNTGSKEPSFPAKTADRFTCQPLLQTVILCRFLMQTKSVFLSPATLP